MIRVEEVSRNAAGMKDFINLPYRLYRNEPHWVPPLRTQQQRFFNTPNPFIKQAEVAFWVAYKGSQPVARVTTHIDPVFDRTYKTSQGFFGFFESEPDSSTVQALMNVAEHWLFDRKVESILGPFNFTASHGIGFLTEGFDRPPTVFMPYSNPAYPSLLKGLGYQPEKELVSYAKEDSTDIPERMTRLIQKLSERRGDALKLMEFDRQRFEEGFKTIGQLYNEVWRDNWGQVPVSDDEMRFFAEEVKSFSENEGICILNWKGKPAAFMLAFPDIHEALIDLPDGRLFPFGWLRFLKSRKKIHTCVIHALGVKSEFRKQGLDLLFIYQLLQCQTDFPNMTRIETTWILENNWPLRRILEAFGAEVVKRYVVLKKNRSPAPL